MSISSGLSADCMSCTAFLLIPADKHDVRSRWFLHIAFVSLCLQPPHVILEAHGHCWCQIGHCADAASRVRHHCARHHVHLCVVNCLYAPLDPEHLPQCVLVPMLHLKVLPHLPEVNSDPWIAHLACVRVDCASSVNLAQLRLHLGKPDTHIS